MNTNRINTDAPASVVVTPLPIIVLDSSSDLLIEHVDMIRVVYDIQVFQHPFGVTLIYQQMAECAIHLIQRLLVKFPDMDETQLEFHLNNVAQFTKFLT